MQNGRMKRKMLTAKEVAEKMQLSLPTVTMWARAGRFAGAVREMQARGPVWMIPEGALKTVVRPARRGRPIKAARNG